ncbi:unnamed protein product [Rotaria magnacalcarata]|uniref:Purinergic receptor n=1 Tax=Rotaria magnacalcarata TaxID=392030 RepID=A0A817AS92_9BILA|nr:unnamed protein product [Rotaria magnacalcarata]
MNGHWTGRCLFTSKPTAMIGAENSTTGLCEYEVGFNFRYASTWKHERDQFRTLTKAYGLRFIIATSGKAGKFDFIRLSLNIGSLVGIFGLATFFCDIIILHLSKGAKLYRKHVFEMAHFRTRFSSAIPSTKMDSKDNSNNRLNPTTNNETTLLNGLITDSTKIRGKTVRMRSVIVNDMNRLHSSPVF